MAHEKSEMPAAYAVDLWNERFFKPRGMIIILAKGEKQYAGFLDHAEMLRHDAQSALSSYNPSTRSIRQPLIGKSRGGPFFVMKWNHGEELFRLDILPYSVGS
jgi:hypothetical protein